MSHLVLPTPPGFDEVAELYHRDGYGIARGLFLADEIASLAVEADALIKRVDLIDVRNLRCRWQTDAQTGACLFDAFDPVCDIGPLSAQAASDLRIHALLSAVLGEPGRLIKDKLIFKPPGAAGYGLHQDFIAWPTFPRTFLTVVVAIDQADAASGCIEVFPGYHRQGCLSPEDGMYHELGASEVDLTRGVKLCLAPGDAAIFSGFTPHRSATNRSRHWRRQLYLSYNADSDGGDRRSTHYDEFQIWLRDRYAEYGRGETYFA